MVQLPGKCRQADRRGTGAFRQAGGLLERELTQPARRPPARVRHPQGQQPPAPGRQEKMSERGFVIRAAGKLTEPWQDAFDR